RLHFLDAVADVLLTWAADTRENHAHVIGTAGRIEIDDDTLVLTADGREERRRYPPPLSDGSAHPDWFTAIADEFITRVRNAGARESSPNLDEGAVCLAAECGAPESSRAGGERRALSGGAVGSARGPSCC